MLLAIVKETRDGEARVAMVPELVGKLVALGYDVRVEPGAGGHAQFADAEYEAAGATLGAEIGDADVVLSVQPLESASLRQLRSRRLDAVVPAAVAVGRPDRRTPRTSASAPTPWSWCRASRARSRWTR